MKKLIFLLLLLAIPNLFSQTKYYTFSELRGMEDSSGHTHLFYRMYYYSDLNGNIVRENSIHHFNISNNVDSLFLFDGGTSYTFSDPNFVSIIDYEFWNNDPSKYIYSGVSTVVDPVPFIKRYDEDNLSTYSLGVERNGNIEISKQNDSLVFASISGDLLKSTDGGRTFNPLSASSAKELISVSPFSDSILFLEENNKLLKSTDRGNSFSTVDTFSTDYKSFFYDKDGIHIYRIVNLGYENYLSVSNDRGNAYSWNKAFTSSDNIFLSVVPSQPGIVYLANGLNIYYSTDYGTTFNLFKKLDRNIIGIYAPASFIIYAATKYDIYKMRALTRTPDSLEIIKHLPVNPEVLNLFPLKVGNEWVYEKYVEMYKSTFRVKVTKDTSISGKKYFKLTNGYYRVDSLTGKLFRYISGSDHLYYDFSATEVGDTSTFDQGTDYVSGWFLESKSSFNKWGINSDSYLYTYIIPSSGYMLNTFVKGVGLYKNEGGELLYSTSILKGFVKDEIVYGDTTVVGITDNSLRIPKEFSISQNYPNPFNPSTKIKYSIPQKGVVTIKVYDILGREIAVLVNEGKPIGEYEIYFDAAKYNLPSGIYFYKLQTWSFNQARKMILLK